VDEKRLCTTILNRMCLSMVIHNGKKLRRGCSIFNRKAGASTMVRRRCICDISRDTYATVDQGRRRMVVGVEYGPIAQGDYDCPGAGLNRSKAFTASALLVGATNFSGYGHGSGSFSGLPS